MYRIYWYTLYLQQRCVFIRLLIWFVMCWMLVCRMYVWFKAQIFLMCVFCVRAVFMISVLLKKIHQKKRRDGIKYVHLFLWLNRLCLRVGLDFCVWLAYIYSHTYIPNKFDYAIFISKCVKFLVNCEWACVRNDKMRHQIRGTLVVVLPRMEQTAAAFQVIIIIFEANTYWNWNLMYFTVFYVVEMCKHKHIMCLYECVGVLLENDVKTEKHMHFTRDYIYYYYLIRFYPQFTPKHLLFLLLLL